MKGLLLLNRNTTTWGFLHTILQAILSTERDLAEKMETTRLRKRPTQILATIECTGQLFANGTDSVLRIIEINRLR